MFGTGDALTMRAADASRRLAGAGTSSCSAGYRSGSRSLVRPVRHEHPAEIVEAIEDFNAGRLGQTEVPPPHGRRPRPRSAQ